MAETVEFVLRIETADYPDADPLHFWLTEGQLRQLVAMAGWKYDPTRRERHQILETLERIERQLEAIRKQDSDQG